MENAPVIQAMMMVPLRTVVPWTDTGLPFEQLHARQERQQAQAHAPQPTAKPKIAPR
jgi:hypothetical protein